MPDVFVTSPKVPHRIWWQYLLLLAMVLCAGYASRRYAQFLPVLIRKRTGDALWACAVFALLGLFRPRWSTLVLTSAALAISYSIEFSQIYHRPWIDHIRSYTLGKLILGTTFFWWDQVAYRVGIGLMAGVDWLLIGRVRPQTD